ncbi:transposase [Frankia sp. AgKG'84/4]
MRIDPWTDEGTPGTWVTAWRRTHENSEDEPLTMSERARLRELEKENAASRQTYGARRIAAALRASGTPASVRLVRRIMRYAGLRACQPRAYRRTTIAGQAPAPADRVRRDFTATRPGTKLVGDITCIRTGEGWLYLATVIDCYSRKVIGWSMADHMRSELITDAFTMAATRTRIQEGATFHSDRGSQYLSAAYQRVPRHHQVHPSAGATGVCWDNSLAESFF